MKRVFAAAAAAGVALSVGLGAVPAWAAEQPAVEPPPIASPAASPPDAVESPTAGGSGVSDVQPSDAKPSDAGLREAALRDLGLTPDEFAAAGQLGKQAAGVAAALRDVPGYLGTRLHGGSILVAGTGAELEAEVARLSVTIPAVTLEATPAAPPSDAPTEETDAPAASGTQSTGTELARSTQELYQAYLRDVGAAGLQAVAYTGSRFVVRTGGINGSEATVPDSANAGDSSLSSPNPDGKISPAEFVARYANVELDAGAPLAPQADLSGGQGYFTDIGKICSAGFSVFDPAGLPGVLTAGHCADDGAAATATVEFPQWNRGGLLGTFGFSQFGGPGNSTVLNPLDLTNPGNVGTDVAAIGSIRADLDPLPAASTWNDPSQAGLDVKIIGAANPVVGQPVCRSGRTSAWSCGTIDEVGIYVVQGITSAPADLRAFNGFLSFDVQSSGGDSGGPWVSGNYAVGTHSAGDTPDENGNFVKNFAVAATLQDSLAVLPGYQLELFLNKPTVTSPAPGATFDAGQTVTGTVAAAPAAAVAAGSKVRITVSGQAPIEVPVDAGGAWSFAAPAVAGPLRFTAETVNGFSTSGAAAFDFAPVSQPSQPSQPAPQSQAPAEVPATNSAVPPKGDSAAVVRPLGDSRAANLANTGTSGLILLAGLAAGALAVGGVFLVLAKRRKRQRPTPTR
ncbi:peptidase [Pseudarthrobacter sp. HLT3-5]|uniref:trypsin-like serine protease n=1 Tax=Pseudarthrobacter cellobiosi TaxID=2953654 RepID=UPI00208E9903|nr:trypsin-like serine protease [Pseudarthrobacter sp. HLT3-5]MCO4276636.1 peptidase [Pseudarthrobacter sp. HLT3-5]